MSLLDTPYQSNVVVKTTSYTIVAGVDFVPFLITAAATATLPLTSTVGFGGQVLANRAGGQGIVRIQNSASSTANVTIAITSGDALFGTSVVAPGQFVDCISDGQGVWHARAPGGGSPAASPRGIHTGQHAAYVSTDGNNSTPVITETYVSEIFVPCVMTITGIALFNGTDVTGNVTVGLATSGGAPITAAKSASTAGSGTDAYQLVPFAAPYVAYGPATYFIQVQYSSGTARYNTHTLGTHATTTQTGQTYGTLASFTPPTTFVTNVGNICGLY